MSIFLPSREISARSWFALLLLVLICQAAKAQENEAAFLYSSQVKFDRRGVPLVTIGMAEGLERIELSASSQLYLHFLEDAGGRAGVRKHLVVPPGKVVNLSIVSASAARVGFWCGVSRLPYGQKEMLDQTVARWREREGSVQVFETGGVMGLEGLLIDNRTLVVAVRRQESEAGAEHEAEEIFRATGTKTFVHQHLEKPPSGVIRIAEEGDAFSFLAVDLVTAEARQSGRVKITLTGGRELELAGEVIVAFDRSGKLVLINRIDVERMLEGLVPAEIPPSVSLEALKAQAVVARGQVFAKLGARHFLDPYLLCASVHCQVYAGAQAENPRASEAVRATRGELLFLGGQLVDTVYSASCGGHTEDNDAVWSDLASPALRGRLDGPEEFFAQAAQRFKDLRGWLADPPPAWCQQGPLGKSGVFRWRRDIPAEDMDRLVAQVKPLGRVVALQPLERGASGRIKLLRVIGTEGELVVQRELPIRKLLGNLRSALFVVDIEYDEKQMPAVFHILGAGWGHGVGMCQAGAAAMAAAGRDYRAILGHYYGGAEVRRVYGE